ncbi:response regulator [Paenibacillus sp. RC67]|uniref:response regulator transcription factor n=1 Tax=Paenibacillus sp. RC67 TaxID=3039392 RepID=UPI0024AE0929|nr:response regulator [Paenibacillus sp. RC67]
MYKVLIVDDEYLIKKSLNKLITESGYGFTTVLEAEDGEEALELVLQMSPDLIITDINMPVMDGLELIRECKVRQLMCEIVILSGYNEFEYARQALRYEVKDYLLKPIRPEQLDNVLRIVSSKLNLKQKTLSMRSDWLWYCKTTGSRLAGLIWDLDEKQVKMELEDTSSKFMEQSTDVGLLQQLCFELLTFIRKELEHRSGREMPISDLTAFYTITEPSGTLGLLEANIMGLMQDIQANRNHGAFHHIKHAAAYIEQHYMEEELSLQSIAEQLNMSLSYASQSFKEALGVTFVQYLIGLRMEKAKDLLNNSNCKTYEAAHAVGYSDYPHFTRTFKKYFGCSPREYRKRIGLD